MDVAIGTAFLAGILTFFAPCTLPLLPGFLGISASGAGFSRRRVMVRAFGFVAGFLVVFMALGIFAGSFGRLLLLHHEAFMIAGGIVIILFSLTLLNIIHIPGLSEQKGISPPTLSDRGGALAAFLIGFAFAFGWTPCLGPILGSILVLAATQATALEGAFLLFVYGLGIAIPFLLVAFGLGELFLRSPRFLSALTWVTRLGGIFLLFLGLSLLFGFWAHVVSAFSMWFDFLNVGLYMSYP